MHSEILKRAAQCKQCPQISKNLKRVIPASKWQPLINCSEPIDEIQLDFDGPIAIEKDQDLHFLAYIDRFSKYYTVEFLIKLTDPM